ncbi:MAG: IS110 family transposase [Acholeplasmataceae bacterium]|nr:IS110 family transposase [Acholeplasmataceae bacterium]
MYLVGIDISKYKHNCFVATESGVSLKEFVFENNLEGFKLFHHVLSELNQDQEIRIGLESTGHYGTNLKQFIVASGYTYLEFNPYLTHQFSKAMSLRKTKTDKVDAKTISNMLGSVDYKTLHIQFYHINELKQLVRDRDDILTNRSKTLVKLTNLLDIVYPEFKPFFNNQLGSTAFLILKKYQSVQRISKLTMKDYEILKSKSKGKLTYPKFSRLKSLAQDTIGVHSKIYNKRIQTLLNDYAYFDQSLDEIDQDITTLFSETQSHLMTIPGLGIIRAATIYAEIGDIHLFSNPQKLIAYAGFDVSINQSGMSEHHGKIVKRGSPLLRKAVWTYALSSLRFIPTFHDYYHKKKSEGKHHKVALTHVCRKLIRMIYHIEYNQINFNDKEINN